jgi:hypothetical protein
MAKIPPAAARTTKAIATAAKNHRVTMKESKLIENAIGADLKANSKNPGWVQRSATTLSAQVDKLTNRRDVSFDPGAKEILLVANKGVLASSLAEAQGIADAKFIAKQFSNDSGNNLRLMGQPYQAVNPKSIAWTHEQAVGAVRIGFDRSQLEPQFIANPRLLGRALRDLPALLRSQGATLEEVLHFERSLIKAYVSP